MTLHALMTLANWPLRAVNSLGKLSRREIAPSRSTGLALPGIKADIKTMAVANAATAAAPAA